MLKIIHPLEHALQSNSRYQHVIFESKSKEYAAIDSNILLSEMLTYTLKHPHVWFNAAVVAEADNALDISQYQRIPRTVTYPYGEMKQLYESLIKGNSTYFHTNHMGRSRYNRCCFDLLLEGDAELAKTDAVRLAALICLMPDDIIAEVVNRLIVCPSKTTDSVYSDRRYNAIRVSEHWETGTGCRLTDDSDVPPDGCWSVGELVERRGNYRKWYKISKISTASVKRSIAEKVALIHILQEQVFASYPKQVQVLQDYIDELLDDGSFPSSQLDLKEGQ